jgi:hypothetical protein
MGLGGATAANCHTVRQSSFYQQQDSAMPPSVREHELHAVRLFTFIRKRGPEIDYHSQWELLCIGSNRFVAYPKGNS